MKTTEILTEMPQNIEDLDWHDLYDTGKNRAFYRALTKNVRKKSVLKVFATAEIFQLNSQFFCLDETSKRVTYYMKFEVGNNGKLGSFVWQSLVWSDEGSPYLSGIPQKIFFEKLVPKFGTIITDSQQTWHGKRFWKLRIKEALDKNLNVYFYNFQDHQIIKLDDFEAFREVEKDNDVWGDFNAHKMKRIVISNKDLPLRKD